MFADLGSSPLANSYLPPERVNAMEPFYPLRALVCGRCFLVQLEEFETPEQIFSDYAYFSSYSSSWLEHARAYAEQMTERLALDGDSHVVEIASNDGYLLQYFHERQIPVLGIEPAANVAKVALQKGIPTLVEFFGARDRALARQESAADLLLGNNVLAHVPDLNDFVAGMKILLAPGGVITMEFPHLMRLIEDNQWDTIYHEHFSYFSFLTASRVFEAHGLRLFDVRGAAHARRLAAHLRRPRRRRRQAARPRPRASCASASAPPATSSLDTYLGYGRRVEADKRQILELPDRPQAAGPAHRRLRRARQGQHAAELLRRAPRLPRLHLRPQPAQAGALPARQPHPDPLAGRDPRGAPGRGADPAVEPHRRRSSSSSASSASGADASPRARRS